ncbi:MAG: type IV pilin protein [Candidatus Polarisedimenticolaceae bacterium]|nr:type IV pilin protein [Candidatus Polarisedimenticolaceae bacterium]
MLEVAMAEERYYTKNKVYSSTLKDLPINSALKDGKSNEGYYTLLLTTSDDGSTFTITATATGTQADDTACKAMTMNQRGEKTSSTSQCW